MHSRFKFVSFDIYSVAVEFVVGLYHQHFKYTCFYSVAVAFLGLAYIIHISSVFIQ